MTSLLELSDRHFRGEISTEDPGHHPFVPLDRIEELGDGLAFYKHFSNVGVLRTGAGLVLIDTGPFLPALRARIFEAVRSFSREAVHTAVYTHGHVDHAYGLPPFLQEAAERGVPRPAVVAHEAVLPRMRRYAETAGYNRIINSRQFAADVPWPDDPVPPTATYTTRMCLSAGGEEIELTHARGETDDHTWVFLPSRRVLFTGDLFIWAVPNAGNPQKVQRYCMDWANALRDMAGRRPLLLLPGHGLPIAGEERVRSALLDTAEYLESIYLGTRDLLNQGATTDDIIHGVSPPAHLHERPYLKPVYDEPEFIARNVIRHLGGWYGGVPSELKPAPRRDQAREIADLAGGPARLARRARELADRGDLRLACHLADWAAEADPTGRETHHLRASLYERRLETETSTMAKGIFRDAARVSRERERERGRW